MDGLRAVEQHNGFLARQDASGAGLFNSHANQLEGGPGVADVLLGGPAASVGVGWPLGLTGRASWGAVAGYFYHRRLNASLLI